MSSLTKHIALNYSWLVSIGEKWDDTMKRAVVTAKYKESLKWAKSS